MHRLGRDGVTKNKTIQRLGRDGVTKNKLYRDEGGIG
jgi:hypothetical protein